MVQDTLGVLVFIMISSCIETKYNKIKDEIAETCNLCNRSFSEVEIMVVTKGQPIEKMLKLYELGQRLFGENRISEAKEKKQNLPCDAEIHMIGQLQSNKAHQALFFDAIHSVDRSSLAKELNKHSLKRCSSIPILIEVNTSGETTKAGVKDWQQMFNLLNVIRTCSRLCVKGLMTVAPLTQNHEILRRCFSTLRLWKEKLCQEEPNFCWNTLSMGMSNDFRLAIKEGSTLVRIGTKFFED